MLEPAWNLARRLERAREFIPNDFANRAEAIMAAILTGAELGQGPMWSLRSMHVVNGKPGAVSRSDARTGPRRRPRNLVFRT